MPTPPASIDAYLASLPADRREALAALRRTINDNLNPGFEEGMQYAMPAWFIPHSVYPPGYHCDRTQPVPFASIASQKNHIGIYLFCVYMSPEMSKWFKDSWVREHAKGRAARLDMGKGCIRVKRLSDIPLALVGEAIRRVSLKDFLALYQASIPPSRRPTGSPDTSHNVLPARGSARKATKSTPGSPSVGGRKSAKKASKSAPARPAKKVSKKVGAKIAKQSPGASGVKVGKKPSTKSAARTARATPRTTPSTSRARASDR